MSVNSISINKCLRCEKELENKRKKFCDSHCKYWYHSIKKDSESHLPPIKKRTKNYFSMITGYSNSINRVKRNRSIVKGAMAAIVNITNEEWVEVNYENVKRHFTSISFWRPNGLKLGDGTWIKEKDIEQELNLCIDF